MTNATANTSPAPTTLSDIAWHTDDGTPVSYANFIRSRSFSASGVDATRRYAALGGKTIGDCVRATIERTDVADIPDDIGAWLDSLYLYYYSLTDNSGEDNRRFADAKRTLAERAGKTLDITRLDDALIILSSMLTRNASDKRKAGYLHKAWPVPMVDKLASDKAIDRAYAAMQARGENRKLTRQEAKDIRNGQLRTRWFSFNREEWGDIVATAQTLLIERYRRYERGEGGIVWMADALPLELSRIALSAIGYHARGKLRMVHADELTKYHEATGGEHSRQLAAMRAGNCADAELCEQSARMRAAMSTVFAEWNAAKNDPRVAELCVQFFTHGEVGDERELCGITAIACKLGIHHEQARRYVSEFIRRMGVSMKDESDPIRFATRPNRDMLRMAV